MRQRFTYFIFLFVLLNGITTNADAQFFKRLFGGRERKRIDRGERVYKSDRINTKVNTKPVPPVKKKIYPVYPPTVFKERYRIDVFVALYLNELVKEDKPTFKGRIPDKAVGGLDFYKGVKLATDSLNKQGYAFDVYIHDVTDLSESPSELIKKKVLDSSDLIIAALAASYLPSLSEFCKKHQINFVSALSPSDAGIRNNPFFIMQLPSLASNCEWVMASMVKKYPNAKPLVLYRKTVTVDSNALGYLDIASFPANMLSCSTMPSKDVLKSFLDSNKLNVLVVPVVDVAYAESVLLKLNEYFPKYNFEVYGMPTWKSMSVSKKPDAIPNIGVNLTMPFYFDQSLPNEAAVSSKYKKENGNTPSEMTFRGYETLTWYSCLLHKYGTVFNTHISDNSSAPFIHYDIKNRFDKNDNYLYLENKHLFLIRYQSSSYIIEQ